MRTLTYLKDPCHPWFPRASRLSCWYYRLCKSRARFRFCGKEHSYVYHHYNRTWTNERAVELPLAWDQRRLYPADRVLEVGNVLAHYYRTTHTVVDKYERAAGVINEDIVDYSPARRYDLILSISTLEHIGWDEQPREPDKVIRVVSRLRRLLSRAGRLFVSFPLGYNPHLDEQIRRGELRFDEQRHLLRVSRDNRWREAEWAEVAGARYGDPFPCGNAIVVGTMHR